MSQTLNPNQPKNQKVNLKTQIPGPKSRAFREREDKLLAPGLQGFALMAGITVDTASGSTVTDVDGNTFIDIIGGIGVNGLGHSHPKWVKAMQDQVARASVGSFTSEPRVKLLEKIAENPPAKGVNRMQLYSGGAEAVESALRLAKCHTGKYEFVSFWGGFHGKTMGALSLMGSDFKDSMGPMVSGSHIVPYANPYRPPVKGMSADDLAQQCVELATKQLKMSSAGKIAAIIIEPMQGTAGNVIPPDTFLPAVAEMAKKFGALLIVDEMITGFGRTGKQWGAQWSGVKPDIVTLGKQFGGGYPVAALMSTDEIVQAKPWGNPSGSSSSYGGNPLAAQAVLTAVNIIEEEKLVENSRVMGEYFLKKIKPFEDKFSIVGDCRGRGLFLAIEMVKDKTTKEPLSKPACNKIFGECLKRGLLTMSYASSFRIQPSLTIDEGTINNAVAIMEEVFAVADKEGWKNF
ncbi:MAG: aspartate aminotransferase family protein [Bdellovibrionales bacterium]|nr:aspartate aminotransferase family protein [Bdellovibrionales bacterium]